MDIEDYPVSFSSEFTLMVNAVPDAVIIIDKSGHVAFWNKAAELIIGYSAGEVLGSHFSNMISTLIRKEMAEVAHSKFKEYIYENTGPENSFFERGIIRRKDASKFIADVSISSGIINDEWYAICILRDVSKQVETETENSYYSDIVKSSNDAIIGIDLDQKVISWNLGAEKIYEYEASEILGESLSVIIPPGRENEMLSEIEKIRSGDSIHSFETQRVKKSGDIVDIILTVSPLKDKFGEVSGASIIASDITREKEMFKTMIKYISEAAMRLKTPAEMVRLNLSNIIDMVRTDTIDEENLIINLSIQMKNTEQIVHNLRELNQAIIGSYEEIPEEYIKYFKK